MYTWQPATIYSKKVRPNLVSGRHVHGAVFSFMNDRNSARIVATAIMGFVRKTSIGKSNFMMAKLCLYHYLP